MFGFGGALRLHRSAVLIDSPEIPAVQMKVFGVFARRDRVGLGAGSDEDGSRRKAQGRLDNVAGIIAISGDDGQGAGMPEFIDLEPEVAPEG